MEAITRTFFLHHAWTQSTGIPPSASLGLALGPRGRPVPAAPPNPTVRTVHSYSVPPPPAGCTPLHTHPCTPIIVHRALVEGSIPGPRTPLGPGLRTLLDPCWSPAGPLLDPHQDPAGPLADSWTLDVCCLRVHAWGFGVQRSLQGRGGVPRGPAAGTVWTPRPSESSFDPLDPPRAWTPRPAGRPDPPANPPGPGPLPAPPPPWLEHFWSAVCSRVPRAASLKS